MIFGGSTKLQVDKMTWRLVIYIHCTISIVISICCCRNWPLISLLASIVFKVSFRAKRSNLLRVVLQQYQSCLRLLMTLDKLDSLWKKSIWNEVSLKGVRHFAEQNLVLSSNFSGLYYKQVTIVIYDRNDSGLYYKTRDDRNWWR